MNKQEYLERLEACLKHKLSREEIEDIMRDYAEYFEEGRRQSKQDIEIAAKLGDPELVAQQLIEESKEQGGEHFSARTGEKRSPWEAARETFKDLETRFLEWDRGRPEKEGGTAQEEEPEQPPRQPEEQPKQGAKKAHGGLQNLWKRFSGSVGHLCQWWFRAISSLILMSILAAVSAAWIGLSALALGALAGGFALLIGFALLCLAAVVLSGLAGWGFGTWMCVAALCASAVGFALDALAAMLLWSLLKQWKRLTARCYRKTASLWRRLLHKVERWLVTEPTGTKSQPDQQQKRPKESEEPEQPQPMALPQTAPAVPGEGEEC